MGITKTRVECVFPQCDLTICSLDNWKFVVQPACNIAIANILKQ